MSSPTFDPSCPSGGSWYACGNGAMFTGCCASDPCTDNGCPTGNLYAASFDASAYGSFPDQECSAGLWYTCTGTSPPFLGCCTSNPCATTTGCPAADLAGGYLSSNPVIANQFDPVPPLSMSSQSPSSSSVPLYSATSQGYASSTSLPTSASSALNTLPSPNPAKTNTGAIAGGAAGGVLVLVLIVVLAWYLLRKKRKQRSREEHQASQETGQVVAEHYGKSDGFRKGFTTAGSAYTQQVEPVSHAYPYLRDPEHDRLSIPPSYHSPSTYAESPPMSPPLHPGAWSNITGQWSAPISPPHGISAHSTSTTVATGPTPLHGYFGGEMDGTGVARRPGSLPELPVRKNS